MQALALANKRRLEAAAVRRGIRELKYDDGLRRCADLIENPTPSAETLRVGHLLRAVQRYGPIQVGRLLAKAGIQSQVAEWKIRQLTERQRSLLAAAIRGRANGSRIKGGE